MARPRPFRVAGLRWWWLTRRGRQHTCMCCDSNLLLWLSGPREGQVDNYILCAACLVMCEWAEIADERWV